MKPVHCLLPFKSRSGHHVELAVVTDELHKLGDSCLSDVRTLVIVCHGKEREAEQIFRQVPGHIHNRRDVIVVAPRFLNGLDRVHGEGILVWKGNEWGEGGSSREPVGSHVSSFEAIDALIAHYRQVSHVFLIGHSMGAQLVQRYTILGAGRPAASPHMQIDYIVMNPSTFLFLNDRPYKYGLYDRQAIVPAAYTPAHYQTADLIQRLSRRHVHYLNGSNDKGVGDDREEAMRQGANRLARAATWQDHLSTLGIHTPGRAHIVPGVSHDAGHMMASSQFAVVLTL
jgi:pimeloyl-ACP methyl ester carboxylesterase